MSDIVVPEMGESIASGIIASWLKQDGDYVEKGEELFELETDKANMPVPSPESGILHISKDEGEEVDVGSVVGTVEASDKPGEKPSGKSASTLASEPESDAKARTAPKSSSVKDEDLAPAVRKLLSDNSLDPSVITATGPAGRILKEDVISYLDKNKKGTSALSPDAAKASAPTAATARLASSTVARQAGERQTRVPMTNIRKRIAERLVESKQSSAHLTTFNEVDMSAVMDIRKKYKDSFEKKHEVKLGFMSFFLKASQRALEIFPDVNAFIDGSDILYNNYVDIGVALSSDRGLMTPVVRDVAQKSFAQIEAEILDFIERAKARRIMPNELTGGTFTISNGGVFGSMLSTPIPNPPQTAILGMHSIQQRPVVIEGEIVARPMMYLALSYDHRLIDGKEAISFLKKIKEFIEDPYQLLLDI